MAPTEILARQHFATLAPLAEAAGIRLAILTGRERGRRTRRRSSGTGRRARSTSWSAPTRCSRTTSRSAISALAVVDEQHRFGVHQRLRSARQGRGRRRAGDDRDADPAHAGADRLSATWMFRELREKPAGRQPVETRAMPRRAPRRSDRRDRRARSTRAPASIGSVRWWRNPRRSTSPPPRTVAALAASASATPSVSSTAR